MKKNFFAAAVLFFSITAQAQDSTQTLNEVVVSATKFPNKTSLTGKIVTIITREQLEQSGAKDLSQVLTEQSGMYINGANSNSGKDKSIYLRGAKVDYTLITVDGVPLYDPSGIGSNFDIRLLSIDNIERIEILKGSQSTLYGSDAMAGVINIITKKASKKPFNVNGNLQFGSYNSIHANTGINGTKNKFQYNVNYSFLKTDGINEATDTITTPHQYDKDGYTKHNVYASLGYIPNKHFQLQPYFRYGTFLQNYDQGTFTDEMDLTANNKNIQAGIRNEITIGNIQLYLKYNYNKINRTYLDDSTKSRNGYYLYSKGDYEANDHFADVFGVYNIHQKIKLTGGIDYRNSNGSEVYHSIDSYGSYDSKLSKDSVKLYQVGAYVAVHYQHPSGFNIEVGGRWNHHSFYGKNFVYNFNPTFLINEKLKVFANISSAYKTPTLYQLYSEYGNKKLKPETALTFEGGLQYFSKNNKVNARITGFNRTVKEVIYFLYNPITFGGMYINQDKQKDYGFEVESSVQVNKNISIKFFYSFVDGKVATVNNGKDTSYFNLIRRPKSTAGLTFSDKVSKKLSFNISLNAVGKQKDLTYDDNFNEVQITLKNYLLCNAYVEYKIAKDRIKLFVDIHNLTNAKYNEVYGFNTMGLNVYGGFRFNY